jgi:hypothetical protein
LKPQKKAKRHSRLLSNSQKPGIFFVLGLLTILISWGFSSPIGSAADDTYHLPSIWCDAEYSGNKGCFLENDQRRVANVLIGSPTCYTQWIPFDEKKYQESAICVNQALKSDESIQSDRVNSVYRYYPDFYYKVASQFVDNNFEKSILIIRSIWPVFLCLNILALFFFANPKLRRSLKLTILFAGSPLLLFLVPSTNPSGAVVAAMMSLACWALVFSSNTGTARQATAILFLALNTFVAIGSRADSFIFLILVFSSGILMGKRSFRFNLASLITYLVSTLFINFRLFSTSELGNIATSGLGNSGLSNLRNINLLLDNLWNLKSYFAGFWGYFWGLGWKFEPFIPSAIPFIMALVFIFSLFGGRIKQLTKQVKIMHIFSILALIAIPIYGLQISDVKVGELVQPRYLFPYAVALMILFRYSIEDFKFDITKRKFQIGAFLFSAATITVQVLMLLRNVNGLGIKSLEVVENQSWWWTNLSFGPLFPLTLTVIGLIFINMDCYQERKIRND